MDIGKGFGMRAADMHRLVSIQCLSIAHDLVIFFPVDDRITAFQDLLRVEKRQLCLRTFNALRTTRQIALNCIAEITLVFLPSGMLWKRLHGLM